MGDVNPSLVQAVLDEEWRSDGGNCLFVNEALHGDDSAWFRDARASTSTRYIAVDTERARQAALGHRALRLLAGGSAVWSSVEDADEVRAIREELRGGK
jgi:hypothetical protein